MIEKIKALEHIARQLEPQPDTRKQWNDSVQTYADDFLDNLTKSKVYQTEQVNINDLAQLPITDAPKDLNDLLYLMKEHLDHTGINPASGYHLGYIPGGGVFPSALGDYLAAITNRYAGVYFASPGSVRMENHLIRWMCKMIGYPDSALGNLASGGSIANLTAIVTAREQFKIKSRDIENIVIYLTEQVHHCVNKAIRIAGLKEAIVRYVPIDSQFRMQANLLQEMIQADVKDGFQPFLVVGSAGTTDTGAIDPLEEIGKICAKYNLWFHVDAAYGGFFMLVDHLKPKFKGIELSDSLAIDPHKGLFLSYGIGAVLIKNVKAQYEAHHYMANYMQDALPDNIELSPADLSPELTKHFRGLRMWLSLHLLGLAPFKAALEEKILLCHYFYEKVQELGFIVGPFPNLSVMIFRYIPESEDANTFNQQIAKGMQDEGTVFLSTTTIGNIFWLRLAVLCFRTHLTEINHCLSLLEEFKNTLLERQSVKVG